MLSLGIEVPRCSDGPLAPTIKCNRGTLRMPAPACLREAHKGIVVLGQVGLPELRGHRSKEELMRTKGPLRPNLGSPGSFVVLPVAHNEVLLSVLGEGLLQGTEARPILLLNTKFKTRGSRSARSFDQ